MSFSERMELNAAGYEPWKDADAYQQIKIEKEDDYLNRKNGQTAMASAATSGQNQTPGTTTSAADTHNIPVYEDAKIVYLR